MDVNRINNYKLSNYIYRTGQIKHSKFDLANNFHYTNKRYSLCVSYDSECA